MREVWKWILWKLRLRLYTPPPFGKRPMFTQTVPDIGDTGGGGWFRPAYRMQDPSKDPAEPKGGESSSAGNDHGWSNCTMSAGAMAAAFATGGDKAPWGGDMRHRQSDLSGGTDLYDLDQAMASLGVSFSVKSGTGWDDVQKYRKEGRAIVIQGTGNVPGSESFDGGHACVISPETQSDASKWLFGDPLATGWQWVSESSIKSWAQAWNSSISYGITSANKPPPPEPEPEPEPPKPVERSWNEDEVRAIALHAAELSKTLALDSMLYPWLEWLRSPRPGKSDVWDAGVWAGTGIGELPPDPCAREVTALWSRGPLPYPATNAQQALTVAALWGGCKWTAALWV